jgi:hypothetical protein
MKAHKMWQILGAAVIVISLPTACSNNDCVIFARAYTSLNEKLYAAKETRIAVEDALTSAGIPLSDPAWDGTTRLEDSLQAKMTELRLDALEQGCDFEGDLLNL